MSFYNNLHPKLSAGINGYHTPGQMMNTSHHNGQANEHLRNNNLLETLGFRLLHDEGPSPLATYANSTVGKGPIPMLSVYDYDGNDVGSTYNEPGSIPIAEDETSIFDPRDIYGYNLHQDPYVVPYSSGWGSNSMLVPNSKRKDPIGSTVGELRKHCCLYGCTLNRHYFHFLSTCMNS